MSDNRCPVCGNQGIPAYHKEDVICSRCGSDLSIYKILSDVECMSLKSENTSKLHKRLIIFLPVIVLILCVTSTYYFYAEQSNLNKTISDNNDEIVLLRDSIAYLTQRIQLKEIELNVTTEIQTYFEYVIIHNDSPWGIVKKFYGIRDDWKELAKQIAIDNKIWDENQQHWMPIHPGQVIRIYNH